MTFQLPRALNLDKCPSHVNSRQARNERLSCVHLVTKGKMLVSQTLAKWTLNFFLLEQSNISCFQNNKSTIKRKDILEYFKKPHQQALIGH